MIAEKTGWSYDFILDGVPWLTIRLMHADAPGTQRIKKGQTAQQVKKVEGDELLKILGL